MTQRINTSLHARHILSAALLACGALAQAQPVPSTAPSRGQLLYTTHCISCHTTDMHWRNKRQAYDWESLKTQVRRWQGNTGLQWADADITEVARYLNDTIYQFPQSADGAGVATSALMKKDQK